MLHLRAEWRLWALTWMLVLRICLLSYLLRPTLEKPCIEGRRSLVLRKLWGSCQKQDGKWGWVRLGRKLRRRSRRRRGRSRISRRRWRIGNCWGGKWRIVAWAKTSEKKKSIRKLWGGGWLQSESVRHVKYYFLFLFVWLFLHSFRWFTVCNQYNDVAPNIYDKLILTTKYNKAF